jgi:hypothetical protein
LLVFFTAHGIILLFLCGILGGTDGAEPPAQLCAARRQGSPAEVAAVSPQGTRSNGFSIAHKRDFVNRFSSIWPKFFGFQEKTGRDRPASSFFAFFSVLPGFFAFSAEVSRGGGDQSCFSSKST